MDNILNQIEHSFNSNSIVIGVLRSAMDKAHEKLQCNNDGPIEFLHERSKFYELSSILVEAVLNIIQEEIDIIENNGETIRLDLMEIEHWLQGRVKQTKSSIVEKDKELKEKIDNEWRLKQALDLKEKELVYLREKLEVEKSNSENQVKDFDESNNSSIYQNEYCRDDIQVEEPECSEFDSERHEQNEVIQQMSSDINILIGTLDFAFCRMHKAEILPLEKKWKWAIEKDIVLMFIRGFLKDINQNVEVKMETRTILNHSSTNLIQERDCQNHNNENMDKKESASDSPIKLKGEIEGLIQQCDDQRMETFLLEEIYLLLFQGLREGIGSTKGDHVNQECIGYRSIEEHGIVRNQSMDLRKSLSIESSKTEKIVASCISCGKLESIKGLLKVDEHESHNSERRDNNNNSLHHHQRGINQNVHVKNINRAMKIACTNSVFLPHIDVDQFINNFEMLMKEKVERNCSRMVDLTHQILELVSVVVSLRKENSLYKKAFLQRCQNLALAEAEVDLLGDQVERTGNMLEIVYEVFCQNSAALSNDIEVSNLMKLIKIELALD